jgi:penicillin-binding protein 2
MGSESKNLTGEVGAQRRGGDRLLLLKILVGLVAAVLLGRLWYLQMVRGESYRVLADRNRFREVDVAAPRGVIYDRNGEILARNRPSFSVVIVPADLPDDPKEVLDRLNRLLTEPRTASAAGLDAALPGLTYSPKPTPTAQVKKAAKTPVNSVLEIPDRQPWAMPRAEIDKAIQEGKIGGAYRPVTVATHIQQDTAFLIAQDAVNLPGISVVLDPIRDYPSGALTSLVIGYMGQIPVEQAAEYEAEGYPSNAQVGLVGLELTFEKELRGTAGQQTIEVDVNGRKVRTIGEPAPAVPGHNLVSTLDLGLQRESTAALQEALDQSGGFTKATQGTVIAMNPRNGAILAMVSLPSYDNNLFAKGITGEAWNALTTNPDRPLFNRAVGGQYPPGSTFKILVASAGLQEGTIGLRTRLGDGFDGVNDGVIWLPNEYFPFDRTKDQPFYSWIHKYGYGHGFVTIRDALAISDDIFFYQLGGGYRDVRGVGPQLVGQYAKAFGLGQLTGIDLPGESRGLVPTPKWKRINYAENWLTGDTYNMSIGQGFILATPLQMANATAAVANRGYLYRPQLVDHVTDADGNVVASIKPELIREVPVNPAHLDTVREGMYGAVNWPQGTATKVRVPNVTVAGKTGTAEFYRDDNHDMKPDRDEKGNLPTHAWFTAFAPYVDPEIVVTVFVANGGEGSSTAAPIATRVLLEYFGAKASQQAKGDDGPGEKAEAAQ